MVSPSPNQTCDVFGGHVPGLSLKKVVNVIVRAELS